MYQTVQNCKHCGANLTLDDMRQPNCRYCGTVFPHQSMAAQHAQVVGQVLHQQTPYNPYGAAPGAYGAPNPYGGYAAGLQQHQAIVQSHMDRSRKIIFWSLLLGLVVPMVITVVVLILAFVF